MQNFNNEIYAEVKIGKHLSSEFKVNKGLRQGDTIAPLMFNVVMEIAIKRSEVQTFFLQWRNSPRGPRPPLYRGFIITLN